MNKDVILSWFDDVIQGKVQSMQTNFGKEVIDSEIEDFLKNNSIAQIQKATRATFETIVLEEGYEVLLLLYSSEAIQNLQR
jgi:hypothetical protein